MVYFPQLAQYPIQKTRSQRTVVNEASDGTRFKARASTAGQVEWRIALAALSCDDRDRIVGSWLECQGGAKPFVFIDPTANLLLWSEDLGNDVWTKGAAIQVNGRALVNGGQTRDRIVQSLGAPAWFHYCMSFKVRGQSPSAIGALCLFENQERQLFFEVSADWKPVNFNIDPKTDAGEVSFGLDVPSGAAIEVAEMQVEAQIGSSPYKPTTTCNGIFRGARFVTDDLVICEDGIESSTVTVRIAARES